MIPNAPDETVSRLLDWARLRLADAGIEQPRREAWRLLAHALDLQPGMWAARDGSATLQAADCAAIRRLVERRALREPSAYITGVQGFWSLDLAVSDATLIPRADSEALIECLLVLRPDRARPLRMLDLGTGTGCLLLAALSEFPAARGIGIDLSPCACALAAANARKAGLERRSSFACGWWSDPLVSPDAKFDVVLSNPPYIRRPDLPALMSEVSRFEPHLALDGGDDGLDAYRCILCRLPDLLAADGVAIVELGAGQRDQVTALALGCGLEIAAVRADLGGTSRALAIRHGRSQK